MRIKTGLAAWSLIFLMGVPAGTAAAAITGPAGFQAQAQDTAEAGAEPQTIYGAPKDIKQRIAIFVFLGWMWLSIGVLIYLLRLKIRELDRLDNLKYFTAGRKTPPMNS
jgi:hypothetical protein